MATSQEKGNALEAAVAAIERNILDTSPSLREKTFYIESKKIIQVSGVHHEIDIFVTIDLGQEYKSVFIFECKNWEDAVGKNEIIVFAENIDVTQAQTGYFVAKSFTKDAVSQAATNPRIRLITASEHDPNIAPLPHGFHGLIQTVLHAEAMLRGSEGGTQIRTIDLASATASFRGESLNLRDYLGKWAEEAASQDSLSFRSERYPEGDYERGTHAEREFAKGEFIVNGIEIASAETTVQYKATVVRFTVVSHFEVQSRGRVVSLAPVQLPLGGTMEMKLIYR